MNEHFAEAVVDVGNWRGCWIRGAGPTQHLATHSGVLGGTPNECIYIRNGGASEFWKTSTVFEIAVTT